MRSERVNDSSAATSEGKVFNHSANFPAAAGWRAPRSGVHAPHVHSSLSVRLLHEESPPTSCRKLKQRGEASPFEEERS